MFPLRPVTDAQRSRVAGVDTWCTSYFRGLGVGISPDKTLVQNTGGSGHIRWERRYGAPLLWLDRPTHHCRNGPVDDSIPIFPMFISILLPDRRCGCCSLVGGPWQGRMGAKEGVLVSRNLPVAEENLTRFSGWAWLRFSGMSRTLAKFLFSSTMMLARIVIIPGVVGMLV